MSQMRSFAQSAVALFSTGLAILILGLGTAITFLPEWEPVPLGPEEPILARADRIARRLNLNRIDSWHIRLTDEGVALDKSRSEREQYEEFLGDRASEWLREHQRTFYVRADSHVENREGTRLSLDLKFSLGGDLVSISAMPNEVTFAMFQGEATPVVDASAVAAALLDAGEKLGEPEEVGFFTSALMVYPIIYADGERVESVQVMQTPNFPAVTASRLPASADQLAQVNEDFSTGGLLRVIWILGIRALFSLGLVALIAVLIAQRSFGILNGLILAAVQFLLVIPPVIRGQQQLIATIAIDFLFLATVFIVFLGWSAAESWYRILSDERTTGLDHLRERIVRYEEGRSLLAGWGVGAGVAGFLLLMMTAAHAFPWIRAKGLSIEVSAFFDVQNPWFKGIVLAIAVVLSFGVGWRWLHERRRFPMAVALATLLVIPVIELGPFPLTILAALIPAAALIWTLQTYRLLGLLTAAVTTFAIPVFAFSMLHPAWQPLEMIVAGGLSLAPLVVGMIGIRKAGRDSSGTVSSPMFVRRLEHERRLRYEMDLLTRMQIGLLPLSPPKLEDWEIAVRSVLPTEVGGDFYEFIEDEERRLWVAMGDVSGHGYQCSIVHAMTKAALLSLVSSRYRPADIMNRLDQVLRHSGTARTFVALALMKIDLATGEVDFSNAASPFPVVVTSEGVSEIEISTLPLGHGPVQIYENHRFTMPEGSAIVFWSDGLYEARNRRDDEYGYERPGTVARARLRQDATTIMEGIFTDWTVFRNGADVEDDTTVLVIKRRERKSGEG